MTNEEAIKDIRDNIKPIVGGKSLDMAIEALSAQPDHHEENLLAYAHDMGVTIEQAKRELQKATAQRTGEWIWLGAKGYKTNTVNLYKCSVCEMTDWFEYNFCPNCGADMRGGDTNGND